MGGYRYKALKRHNSTESPPFEHQLAFAESEAIEVIDDDVLQSLKIAVFPHGAGMPADSTLTISPATGLAVTRAGRLAAMAG